MTRLWDSLVAEVKHQSNKEMSFSFLGFFYHENICMKDYFDNLSFRAVFVPYYSSHMFNKDEWFECT